MEKDSLCNDFQNIVPVVQLRHKSILDIISKSEESTAKINRAVIKSVTSCGCISMNATKQQYDKETLQETKKSLSNHIDGELCEICKEKIEEEIGEHLYYIAALCETLGLSLNDIIEHEYKELKTLGLYSLL